MKILGIDAGTSNSCVAVVKGGRAELIPPADSRSVRVTPSVIGFQKIGGKVVVGALAKTQQETNPAYTFHGLKRLLGRKYSDPYVVEFAGLCAYGIVEGPNGAAWVQGPDQTYSPEELISHIFRKLKEDAQARLAEPVTHCVLAVPAHFDPHQREAMKSAAIRAGLEVAKIIDEPTAAALAYGMDRSKKSVVAVYDFGGGTFDVSIMRVDGREFKILGRSGDPFLGGMDFDRRLASNLAEGFQAQTGVDPLDRDNNGAIALQRLLDKAETTKVQLSSAETVPLELKYLARNPETKEHIHLECEVSREQLETLCADLIERTIAPCEAALKQARLRPADIDDVVLVGGMTAMPAIQKKVAEVFGRLPRGDVNPDEVVAFGCAIVGAAMQGALQSVSLNEKTLHTIGIGDADGAFVPMIKRGSAMPAEKSFEFTTDQDDQETVAVPVYEGERDAAGDNRLLFTLALAGLTKAQKGDPQFRVTMAMGQDGTVTGILETVPPEKPMRHSIKVHTASGMTQEDLEALRNMEAA
mgnify:CR=1 FL=1